MRRDKREKRGKDLRLRTAGNVECSFQLAESFTALHMCMLPFLVFHLQPVFAVC